MDQLTKGKNMNSTSVTVSAPKSLDNGAKLVYVNYDNSRFNVQTPWMDMPWDLSCFSEGQYPKYSMEMSFRGIEEDPDQQAFLDRLNQLDQRLIDFGVENSVQWFKKKNISRDTVEALYNPIVRVSKDKETGEPDGKWPSTFRLKVPNRDGRWTGTFLNSESGKPFNVNNSDAEDHTPLEKVLVKSAKVRGIIQCVGLWIASGNYMCQWQLVKAEVKVPSTASNCDFIPDSDGEEDDETGGTQNLEMLESSEDESGNGDGGGSDEDVEEEEVVAPPPKKAVKKAMKVKKSGK